MAPFYQFARLGQKLYSQASMKAIVLLSGGLDSATCLYWARSKGFKPFCLAFDYGQRHIKEIQNARTIAARVKAPFQVVQFSLPWGGSSLVNSKEKLPHHRPIRQMSHGGIPSTYVPARNTIFLSFALSYADASGAQAIVIGANAIDYSGYPDCRPRYMKAVQKVALLGTKMGTQGKKIELFSPLIRMTKSEIIDLGTKLKVPYELTWSCYQGGNKPCGTCDSCILRRKGFDEAQQKDPLL